MRIFFIVLPVLLACTCLIFAGCGSKNTIHTDNKQDAFENHDTVIVSMKAVSDSQVVVFTSEHARILIGYNSLMHDLQIHIDHYDVGDDRELKNELLVLADKGDTVYTEKLIENRMLRERLEFRLADILDKGEALVIDTHTNKAVSWIMVEHYAVQFHKLAGRGGRLYMLPGGNVFLAVLDWIS